MPALPPSLAAYSSPAATRGVPVPPGARAGPKCGRPPPPSPALHAPLPHSSLCTTKGSSPLLVLTCPGPGRAITGPRDGLQGAGEIGTWNDAGLPFQTPEARGEALVHGLGDFGTVLELRRPTLEHHSCAARAAAAVGAGVGWRMEASCAGHMHLDHEYELAAADHTVDTVARCDLARKLLRPNPSR